MEDTTTTCYDLENIIKIENLNNAENKKDFLNNNNLSLKCYLGSTSLQYNIIQYQKQLLSSNIIRTLGLFRSVIFDNNYNLLSYSPPKSVKFNIELLNENTLVEEFIEGTMINMFYDNRLNDWEIATRSTIGGNVKFYKHAKETFNEMFYDVFNNKNIKKDDLKKDHSYSFILQHKGNRIVVPFENNNIYLADSYKIDGTMKIINSYDNDLVNKYTFLKIPSKKYSGNYNEIIENYACSGKTDYKIVGVVFKNNDGTRMKIRNPEYEAVRKLRGNQCKDQYNYLSLRRDGNISLYLKHYPEDKKRFAIFRNLVHKATDDLYKMYQKCYIFKESELKTFPSEFKTHMYKLHYELYLLKLKPDKKNLQFNDVKEYINRVHPSLLMNMINKNATHVMIA